MPLDLSPSGVLELVRRARTPEWLPKATLAACLGAIVLTLALCRYVPFQDLPNHIEVLELDRALRSGQPSPYFEAAPGVAFGYSLHLEISRLLTPLIGAAGVVRLLCIASAVGIPLAAVPLARATGAPPAWAAVLALPIALSWPLRVGLLPYALALPFVELGLAAALRAARDPGLRSVLSLGLCGIATYLAHPMAFGLLAGLAGMASLLPGQGAHLFVRRVARVGVGLAAAAPLFAHDLVGQRMSVIRGDDTTLLRTPLLWRPLPRALGHIVTRGLGVTGPDALRYYVPYLLVLAWATLLVLWPRRGDERAPFGRHALLAATLMGTLGAVLLPESRENVFIIASRVNVLGVLFLAALAAHTLLRTPFLQFAAVPAVLLTVGFQLVEVVGKASIASEVLGTKGPVQVDGAYLPVRVMRSNMATSDDWGNYDPLRHSWAYALGPRGATPYIFAGSRYQPIWFKSGILGHALRAPGELIMTENDLWRPPEECARVAQERLAAANAWDGSYDGVLVVGRQPELDEAIAQSGMAVDRWLSPGLVLLRRGKAIPGLKVQFGRLAGTTALRSGFSEGEIIDGLPGQWSQGKESILQFTLDHVKDAYLLRARAESPVLSSIAVTANGSYRVSLPVTEALSENAVFMSGSAFKTGTNEIRMDYSETFWPTEPGNPGPPRELSVLYRDLELVPLSAGASLDVGTTGARANLESGFSGDEKIDGRTAAWSDGTESVARLDLSGGEPAYVLSIVAKAIVKQAVTVTINEHWTGTVEVGDAWSGSDLVVPGDVITPGRNTVRFAYGATLRPADEGRGGDTRSLGLAFDAISLTAPSSSLHVDCGASEARSILSSGFSRPETVAGRDAVWSDGKSSEIDLIVSGPAVAHRLTLEVSAWRTQRATIVWNGGYQSDIVVPPSWKDISVVVPAGVVRPGANSLRITYESPGHLGTDTRLLAVAYHDLLLEPARGEAHVEFGTPAGRTSLGEGWAGDEVIDGRPAVWSLGPSSEVELFVEPSLMADPSLDFSVSPFASLVPLPVQVMVNDRPAGSVVVSERGWQSFSVKVPKDLLRSGTNRIRWIYGRLGRPRDLVPGSNDARELALAFASATLR